MTEEEFKSKYKTEILPHSKSPYHFEQKEGPYIDAYNPLCGDHFKLFIESVGEHIHEAHFHGFGCAISKASTSLLMKHVENKSKEEITTLIKDFLDLLLNQRNEPLSSEDLNSLAELRNFNGRLDCVKLSWEALLKEIEGKNE